MNPFIKLALEAILPVVISVMFYLLDKKTKFGKINKSMQQLIIGICFGAVSVLASENGVDIGGASANVRDSAPLCAGLLFGAPAGIIAGLIGGVERWFSVLWGGGTYTQLACTIATILAGVFGALCRKLMFDDKKPSWFYGLAIGMTTEVMHMLLIFITNMSDVSFAFTFVEKASIPMITVNGVSVMMAALVISLIGKEKIRHSRDKKQIAQTFQRELLIVIIVGFAVTSLFTFSLQSRISSANTDNLLRLNTEDVRASINDSSDRNLLRITHSIADGTTSLTSSEELNVLKDEFGVSEINLINADGIIVASTMPDFIHYDMSSGEQSSKFLVLLNDTDEYVQSYQPISYDENTLRKYAGVSLPDGGFVQVGYNADRFHADIAQQVQNAAKNRRIGQSGCIIICDENFNLVSGNADYVDEFINIGEKRFPADTRFEASVYGVNSYCMYTVTEGYYIVATIPVSEAVFSRDIAVYVSVFMEILVFAALFINIYFLIKRLVVDNIHKVNHSLAQITGGNLNVTVDVRENEEFASLSDDINSTVTTLKQYIADAAARIDKELQFAQSIQHSALPNIFPPYPNRTEFDIYAYMATAKEVGGDFYDFYLLGRTKLAILIADVSGKGIPAAMFMMTAKTQIKSYAESGLEVNDVFTQANAKLCEGNEAGMFVTAWMGIVDLKTGMMTYANAGHNPPVIKRSNGKYEYLKSRVNFILAGMEGTKYIAQEMQLNPGDRIYLYTDGVTEATDTENQLYGEDRLLNALNSLQNVTAEQLCKKVKENVDMFVGDAPQFDDITMLSLELKNLQSAESITTIPNQASVADVEDFINKRIEKLAVTQKYANKIRIAIDEIYTNIRQYSGASQAQIILRMEDNVITVILRDNGIEYNPTEAKEPDTTLSAEERQIGGLGILMVKKIMTAMEYRRADDFNELRLTLTVS